MKLFYNLNTLWNLVTNFWYTLQNLLGDLQDQAQDAQQQAESGHLDQIKVAAIIGLIHAICEATIRLLNNLYALGQSQSNNSNYFSFGNSGGCCQGCLSGFTAWVDSWNQKWKEFQKGPYAKYLPILLSLPQLIVAILIQAWQEGSDLITTLSLIWSSVVMFLRLNVYVIFDFLTQAYLGPLKDKAKAYIKAKKASKRAKRMWAWIGF